MLWIADIAYLRTWKGWLYLAAAVKDAYSARLSERGATYGLCQISANEPWHFERRPDAAVNGCPPLYADPTHAPRMQQ